MNVQVAGHGNFGSLDNDPPAAMRYTECRLQAVSSAVMLADLAYDTVDFAPNFDNSQVRTSPLECTSLSDPWLGDLSSASSCIPAVPLLRLLDEEHKYN